uniref:Uncharacterized protein n=1 Tax=viral metagenome TaxID=1070528 RepID=A0A6M3L8F7_9ZZZZ
MAIAWALMSLLWLFSMVALLIQVCAWALVKSVRLTWIIIKYVQKLCSGSNKGLLKPAHNLTQKGLDDLVQGLTEEVNLGLAAHAKETMPPEQASAFMQGVRDGMMKEAKLFGKQLAK